MDDSLPVMSQPDTDGGLPNGPLIQVWASCKCFIRKDGTEQ